MNCKEEFLYHIKDGGAKNVKCAYIKYEDDYNFGAKEYKLKVNHTYDDFEEFVNKLDFEYDEDYGAQELFGTIWYDDNTWSERDEYDGSEWWSYKKSPTIPEELM